MDSIQTKILIRTPNWVGDLVMSTGFLRAILETFPDSQVDIILKSGFETLPIPHRGEIILFDKNKDYAGKFGKSLRHKNYDFFMFYLLVSRRHGWYSKAKFQNEWDTQENTEVFC